MDAGIVERQRIMSTVWVHAAAGCAAIASWLYKAPSRHDSRLPGEEPAVAHDCGSSWTILILRMLQPDQRGHVRLGKPGDGAFPSRAQT